MGQRRLWGRRGRKAPACERARPLQVGCLAQLQRCPGLIDGKRHSAGGVPLQPGGGCPARQQLSTCSWMARTEDLPHTKSALHVPGPAVSATLLSDLVVPCCALPAHVLYPPNMRLQHTSQIRFPSVSSHPPGTFQTQPHTFPQHTGPTCLPLSPHPYLDTSPQTRPITPPATTPSQSHSHHS